MAYQSGIYVSPDDLLDKIRLFAASSCGYAQLMHQPDGDGYRLHLQHAASGQFVHLHSYLDSISWYGSTSFDGGLAYSEQTVASGSFSVAPLPGNAKYFLFGGDGWCYCVAQLTATAYAAILFGAIVKICAFDGGAFVSDAQIAHVRADIDGLVDHWDLSRAFQSSITRQLDAYSPIAFNGVTPLYTVTVEVGRATPSDFRSMVGYAPGLRLLRMAGQYVNEDVVALGSDIWMVFDLAFGYAFLK